MSLSSKKKNDFFGSAKVSLVIEDNDINFKKIEKKLQLSGFKIKRVGSFDEAFHEIKEAEFQKIVCPIDLTRKEVFEFIGVVRSLPYHHPNLIINTEEVLTSLKKIEEFQSFFGDPEISRDLENIIGNDFESLDPSKKTIEFITHIKLSTENNFNIETSYIFLVGSESIYIGAQESLEQIKKIHLDIYHKGKRDSSKLNGEFNSIKAFDENKGDTKHYCFQVATESLESWKVSLSHIEENDPELDQLLINLRGY